MKRIHTAALVAGVYLLASGATFAQVPIPNDVTPVMAVDAGPAVVTVLDTVQGTVWTVFGAIVSLFTLYVSPMLVRLFGATLVKMASDKVWVSVHNVVEGGLDELRQAAVDGRLRLTLDARIAQWVEYLLTQIPFWLRLAGIDEATLTNFVRTVTNKVIAADPLIPSPGVGPTALVVAPTSAAAAGVAEAIVNVAERAGTALSGAAGSATVAFRDPRGGF